jgi:hypothetical protein
LRGYSALAKMAPTGSPHPLQFAVLTQNSSLPMRRHILPGSGLGPNCHRLISTERGPETTKKRETPGLSLGLGPEPLSLFLTASNPDSALGNATRPWQTFPCLSGDSGVKEIERKKKRGGEVRKPGLLRKGNLF